MYVRCNDQLEKVSPIQGLWTRRVDLTVERMYLPTDVHKDVHSKN
jgi:hypothetical protein